MISYSHPFLESHDQQDWETQEATMFICLSQKINRFNSINSSVNLLLIPSMNLKNRKNYVFKKICKYF